MSRIFKTDTVYEILFKCVSVLASGMAKQEVKKLNIYKYIYIAYISIPSPAFWRHTGVPAGYGSIFISDRTFSFSVTLLMPVYGYSSGQLIPALVCVRDRGGENWSEHRQRDPWNLKYGWNVFRRRVRVCLTNVYCVFILPIPLCTKLNMEFVYCW